MKNEILKMINDYDGPITSDILDNIKLEKLIDAIRMAMGNAKNGYKQNESTRILDRDKYAVVRAYLNRHGCYL